MDGIKEMLDRLSELDEGQLSDLESKIIDEFNTVEKQEPTAQVVDSMTALADALDAVRGEQTSRVAAAQDLEKRAAEATSRVKPKQEEDGDVPPAAEDEAPVEEAPAEAPTDLPTEVPTEAPAEAPAEEPVAEGEEETEEEKKKRLAAPGTFEAKEAEDSSTNPENPNPEPTSSPDTTSDNEPTGPDNVPSTPDNEPSTPSNTPGGPENTPTGEVEQPAAVTAPPAEVPTTNPPAQQEEIPVAASASDVVVTPPAENRPVPRQSASVAITAGADIPGFSAGTELTSSAQVTDAFMKRLHNLSRVSSPNGQQYTVATITAEFPEDRVLQAGDVEGNWEKIQDVAGVQAIVAAAGSCLPLEIKYDIYGVGSTDTPVRDSLPSFTADRGGIRFYPGPLLPSAGYDAGMGIWDPTDGSVTKIDAAFSATTPVNTKPCYPVQCLPFTEAVLEAVTMCLCFDNLTGRVFPELVARHNELALIQHARLTEQYLLSKIKSGATNTITATGTLGAAREILGQVDKVSSVLRYRNRISPTQSFRAIFPYWLHDMIRADISYQMPGDGLSETMALADAKLDGWFRARNINPTWSLEAALGVTAVPGTIANVTATSQGFPATVEWDLFAEGAWLVLDGGTLDLGVIRDSTHVANNTYCEFTESFYNVARVGGESVHVTSTIKPTGGASALVAVS